jgi:tetratricopeptide (TPR) repeat protein
MKNAKPRSADRTTSFARSCLAWRGPRRAVAGALALVVVALVAYAPVLQGGFLWDDDTMLYRNPAILAPDGLTDIWFTSTLSTYFPLTSSMFWVEWRLWGRNPVGYRIVNVLLHALGATLLWRLLARLRVPGAWVAAAVFAVHPVAVASVGWIAERKNTLSLPLFLFALLAAVRFEDESRRGWYAVALGAFALALLAKTSVVMLPVVLVGLAWYRRGAVTRRDLVRTMPFFVVASVLGVVTVLYQGEGAMRPEGVASRVAATAWAVWFYLGKALLPLNLAMVYPRWDVQPSSLLAWLPLAALAIVVGVVWRSRADWRWPALAAFGYFVALLLPVLGLVGWSFHQHSLVSDHLQYAALAGPIVLVVGATASALERRRVAVAVRIALAATVLVTLASLTWVRATVFQTEETLWRDTLARSPSSWAAQNNYGRILADRGESAAAERHYREALRLLPAYAHAHNNLGIVLGRQGRDAAAERHYREAIRLDAAYGEAYTNLGNLLARTDRVAAAVAAQQTAARLDPDVPEVWNNLGLGLAELGRVDEALAAFDHALRLNPHLAHAHHNRGGVLFRQGRFAEAGAAFATALRINPDLEVTRQALARVEQAGARRPPAPRH